MISVLGIVIDSSTFATVIGVSFTAVIAMIAYIVKTLAAIDSRVAVQKEKIDGLERREAIRSGSGQGYYRMWIAAVVAVLGIAFLWVALFANVSYTNQRRHDNCLQQQSLYDGQITYTRFLAKQFHATPQQTHDGLVALRKSSGPRPTCS
jgi:hypothetical protein